MGEVRFLVGCCGLLITALVELLLAAESRVMVRPLPRRSAARPGLQPLASADHDRPGLPVAWRERRIVLRGPDPGAGYAPDHQATARRVIVPAFVDQAFRQPIEARPEAAVRPAHDEAPGPVPTERDRSGWERRRSQRLPKAERLARALLPQRGLGPMAAAGPAGCCPTITRRAWSHG